MNKRIIKALCEPEESFESWAKKNNIIPDKGGAKKKKTHAFQRWVLSAASAVLAFVMILPFVIKSAPLPVPIPTPPEAEPPVPAQEKTYSVNEVKNIQINLQDLLILPGAILFDANLIIEYENIFKDVPIEDESIDLAYKIFSCLISDSETYAFVIDYTVRIYEKYEFSGISNYSEFESETIIGNKRVKYRISNAIKGKTGYAAFRIGNYNYYIKAEGFEGVTELTEENLIFLLQLMLENNTEQN